MPLLGAVIRWGAVAVAAHFGGNAVKDAGEGVEAAGRGFNAAGALLWGGAAFLLVRNFTK